VDMEALIISSDLMKLLWLKQEPETRIRAHFLDSRIHTI